MPESELFGLFPTPVRRLPGVLEARLVAGLVDRFTTSAQQHNTQSTRLLHTELVTPKSHPLLQEACRLIVPHVVEFGELLLGERLTWTIKEIWVNVLEPGGRQSLHNHANSFISGVLYLTDSHPSASTVFAKAAGSTDYVFNNENARAESNAYNAGKWVAPDPVAGDMLLFPSYLLHEVPENRGPRRISVAFNAIPHRLDSWGYTLGLSR
ncbi:MAG TPA: TIGR02466 family protein [Polyangiales bacterium]|nr:TIGR02466 family protein [Polyangiales bacterium]